MPTPSPESVRLRPSPARRALAVMAIVPALLAWMLAAPPAAGAAAPPGFDDLAPQGVASMVPPGPGRAKEFSILRANGLFHIFYMRDNPAVAYDSTERDIGHAVSNDLVHWTQLATVLPIRPDKWDNWHVWAPTVVEQNGTYFMWYVGVTRVPYAWTWYQRIGLATSTDLVNWTRYDQPVYGGSMVPWAYADSSLFDGCQFRDPWVMPDPANPGQWLMYYVTEPASAHGQLIVGEARNSGGFTPWRDVGPLWCTDAAHYWGWVESPCVFQHAGLWYLFCTTTSGHVLNFRVASTLTTDSTAWSGKYRLWDMVGQNSASDNWFGIEHLAFDGHDYLAYVNPLDNGIDIQEMTWGTPPAFFTLGQPRLVSVTPPGGREPLALSVVGRARGDGVVLRLGLPEASPGRLEVFDVAGRRVRTLRAGELPAGVTLETWDLRDAAGATVPRGIYFARLACGAGRRAARVLVTD